MNNNNTEYTFYRIIHGYDIFYDILFVKKLNKNTTNT